MEPWAAYDSDQTGWALAWLCWASGDILSDPYDFTQLGWDDADDPDTTPIWFLPHLAMKNGVRLIPNGLTEEQQRARVRSTDGLRRGTPDAIIGAARQYLSDPVNATVILLERTNPDDPGDQPYHYTVITYTDETPDSDLVEAALLEQKPVGHILHYLVIGSWTYLVLAGDYDEQDYDDLAGDYPTYADLRDNNPT
jgi:hypothetical protein